jgi:hypothetical protein
MYGRVIASASKGNISVSMKDHIALDAQVRTKNCAGYSVLYEYFNNIMQKMPDKKGNKLATKQRANMIFNAWLRGVRLTINHFQTYADDFIYRIKKHIITDGIFEKSLVRIVKSEKYPYKKF